MPSIDWQGIFVPSQGIVEVVLRGTLVYFLLFVVFRFFLKRQAGALGITDLLLVVLIADASQNALGSEYRSVTEGAALVLTIVFWDYLLDWLAFRFPWFERFARPRRVVLVEDGRVLQDNMRREKITTDELMSQLRHHGVEEESEVKRAVMEGDGRLSVIKRGPGEGEPGSEPRRGVE